MDAIDRQAAIDAFINVYVTMGRGNGKSVAFKIANDYADIVKKRIESLPSVQPERKKGKWTKGSDMPPMKHRNGKPKKFWLSIRYCSVCGHEAFDDSDWGEQLFDWCPYCGADMRGEEHETD